MTGDTFLKWAGVEETPERLRIVRWLDQFYLGIYHKDWRQKLVVEGFTRGGPRAFFWTDVRDMSTFDFDYLTRGVFLAHDLCLRFEVYPGPNRLKMCLHARDRQGGFSERHPDLETALSSWRANHTEVFA